MSINKSKSIKPVVIITGASSGIGEAAARALANEARLIIVGTSDKTKEIASQIGAEYFLSNFLKISEVRKLAKSILESTNHIDILVNNAGTIMEDIHDTKDGFEATFQVNYLAQFILTNLLMPTLIKSGGSIINTSSAAHKGAKFSIDNIQIAKKPFEAYSNTKLLGIFHAKELSRRYGSKGVIAVSFHPGVVATNFARKMSGPIAWIYNTSINKILKTPDQGADTLVWLIRNRRIWQAGAYYVNRKIVKPHRLTKDIKLSKEIWQITENMLLRK